MYLFCRLGKWECIHHEWKAAASQPASQQGASDCKLCNSECKLFAHKYLCVLASGNAKTRKCLVVIVFLCVSHPPATHQLYLFIYTSIYLCIYRARCAFIRMQWAAPWQSLKLPFQQLISYASLKRSVLSVSLSRCLSHSFLLPLSVYLSVCLPRLWLFLSSVSPTAGGFVVCFLLGCTCKSVR